MAYKKHIVLISCSGCGSRATYMVFNMHDVLMGHYCSDCTTIKIDALKRTETGEKPEQPKDSE